MELYEKLKMFRFSAKVFKKGEEQNSYEYWLTQTPKKRPEAF